MLHDHLSDDQIRRAYFDLESIDRSGMKRDLDEELQFVRREFHDRRFNRTIGDDLRSRMLGDDLAKLLGIDRDRVQRVAGQQLSWPQTCANVLARLAADARNGVAR